MPDPINVPLPDTATSPLSVVMVLLPEETAVMPRALLVFEIPDTFTEPFSVLMVLLPKMVADMP